MCIRCFNIVRYISIIMGCNCNDLFQLNIWQLCLRCWLTVVSWICSDREKIHIYRIAHAQKERIIRNSWPWNKWDLLHSGQYMRWYQVDHRILQVVFISYVCLYPFSHSIRHRFNCQDRNFYGFRSLFVLFTLDTGPFNYLLIVNWTFSFVVFDPKYAYYLLVDPVLNYQFSSYDKSAADDLEHILSKK